MTLFGTVIMERQQQWRKSSWEYNTYMYVTPCTSISVSSSHRVALDEFKAIQATPVHSLGKPSNMSTPLRKVMISFHISVTECYSFLFSPANTNSCSLTRWCLSTHNTCTHTSSSCGGAGWTATHYSPGKNQVHCKKNGIAILALPQNFYL